MPDDTPKLDNPDGEDAAGYGRPPRDRRFRPGQSGNPKGRPTGSRNLASLLAAELRRPVTVTEGGRTRRVPKAAAMAASQVNKALKGDTRAFNTVLQATRPRGGPDSEGPGPADLEKARGILLDRIERIGRQHAEDRDRLAAELAAAGVAAEHVELLFGPRGDRLRERLTAALGAVQARGFDIRSAAQHSVFADVAGECAEALPGDAPGG